MAGNQPALLGNRPQGRTAKTGTPRSNVPMGFQPPPIVTGTVPRKKKETAIPGLTPVDVFGQYSLDDAGQQDNDRLARGMAKAGTHDGLLKDIEGALRHDGGKAVFEISDLANRFHHHNKDKDRPAQFEKQVAALAGKIDREKGAADNGMGLLQQWQAQRSGQAPTAQSANNMQNPAVLMRKNGPQRLQNPWAPTEDLLGNKLPTVFYPNPGEPGSLDDALEALAKRREERRQAEMNMIVGPDDPSQDVPFPEGKGPGWPPTRLPPTTDGMPEWFKIWLKEHGYPVPDDDDNKDDKDGGKEDGKDKPIPEPTIFDRYPDIIDIQDILKGEPSIDPPPTTGPSIEGAPRGVVEDFRFPNRKFPPVPWPTRTKDMPDWFKKWLEEHGYELPDTGKGKPDPNPPIITEFPENIDLPDILKGGTSGIPNPTPTHRPPRSPFPGYVFVNGDWMTEEEAREKGLIPPDQRPPPVRPELTDTDFSQFLKYSRPRNIMADTAVASHNGTNIWGEPNKGGAVRKPDPAPPAGGGAGGSNSSTTIWGEPHKGGAVRKPLPAPPSGGNLPQTPGDSRPGEGEGGDLTYHARDRKDARDLAKRFPEADEPDDGVNLEGTDARYLERDKYESDEDYHMRLVERLARGNVSPKEAIAIRRLYDAHFWPNERDRRLADQSIDPKNTPDTAPAPPKLAEDFRVWVRKMNGLRPDEDIPLNAKMPTVREYPLASVFYLDRDNNVRLRPKDRPSQSVLNRNGVLIEIERYLKGRAATDYILEFHGANVHNWSPLSVRGTGPMIPGNR